MTLSSFAKCHEAPMLVSLHNDSLEEFNPDDEEEEKGNCTDTDSQSGYPNSSADSSEALKASGVLTAPTSEALHQC